MTLRELIEELQNLPVPKETHVWFLGKLKKGGKRRFWPITLGYRKEDNSAIGEPDRYVVFIGKDDEWTLKP